MRHTYILLSTIICALIFSSYATAMTLTSPSFSNGQILPTQYSCDGKNVSPELQWSDNPANAQSFALIFTDPDAPGGTFYHWALFNIPKTTRTLPEAMQNPPTGSLVGANTWQQKHYRGPCPPKGATHHYIFTLYALDTLLTLPAGSDAASIEASIKNHILASAELQVTYGR